MRLFFRLFDIGRIVSKERYRRVMSSFSTLLRFKTNLLATVLVGTPDHGAGCLRLHFGSSSFTFITDRPQQFEETTRNFYIWIFGLYRYFGAKICQLWSTNDSVCECGDGDFWINFQVRWFLLFPVLWYVITSDFAIYRVPLSQARRFLQVLHEAPGQFDRTGRLSLYEMIDSKRTKTKTKHAEVLKRASFAIHNCLKGKEIWWQ